MKANSALGIDLIAMYATDAHGAAWIRGGRISFIADSSGGSVAAPDGRLCSKQTHRGRTDRFEGGGSLTSTTRGESITVTEWQRTQGQVLPTENSSPTQPCTTWL